jgi:hypothetical protein
MKDTFFFDDLKPGPTLLLRGQSGSRVKKQKVLTIEENALDTTLVLSILQFDLSNSQCWRGKKKLTCDAIREFWAILRLARALRQKRLKSCLGLKKRFLQLTLVTTLATTLKVSYNPKFSQARKQKIPILASVARIARAQVSATARQHRKFFLFHPQRTKKKQE